MSTNVFELPIPISGYVFRVRARSGYERNPAPRIYVADEISNARDSDLADLVRQEKALGERRFAARGTDPDVDALCDRLNAEIMRVKTAIAQEVLVFLAADVTGDVDAAVDRAFFSRNAGCETCSCSPGVVAGVKLLWNGGTFDVWVDAA